MPWTSLRISPGVIRNGTRYGASGTWYDCSLVRFRDGYPERWGGWINAYPGYTPPVGDPTPPVPAFTMNGMCRSLHRHGALDGTRWTSAGTSKKFYMIASELKYDVTPYETAAPINLGANPLATTSGSKVVTVTHVAHQHFSGDSVEISGVAAAIGGIPATDFNKEHVITAWVSEDSYTITVATTATSSTVGGGAAGTVKARYVFSAGSDDVVTGGGGWGTGVWSGGVWGTDPSTVTADQLGIWTQDNWGEDLVACANTGPIFYWDATAPSTRMVNIRDLPGADGNAPAEAQFIIVSHRDRHLLAFGCSLYAGGGVVDPMLVRWCDQESIFEWDEASTIQTSGSLPLSNGSKFISGIATTREILAWSDQALYSLQYIGAPYVYTADILEKWSDILGLKARCIFNGVVYWMGRGGFYAYSGRVEKLACPIWDYIRLDINMQQAAKVYASSSQRHNEVLFFYPSTKGVEVDSYASLDTVQGIWTFGLLARTAWLDIDAISPTIATDPSTAVSGARMFQHDSGSDDGSVEPPAPINAFIESGPIELSSDSYGKGDRMMFVRAIMPDVTFRGIETSATSPQMNIVLKMQDEPGSSLVDASSSQVQRGAIVPVEQFTRRANVRLRGRSLTLRAESNSLGSEWRLGITRIDARTDGQR